MRNSFFKILLISFFGLVFSGFKNSDFTLLLKSGNYQVEEGQIMQSLTGPAINNYYYRIMQFYAVPNEAQKKALQDLGIVFFDYLPKNAFLVALPKNIEESQITQFNVRSISVVQKEMKLSKLLSTTGIPDWATNGDGTARFVLGFYPNISKTQIAAVLKAQNADFTFGDEGFVKVSVAVEKLDFFATSDLFYYIQEADPESLPENFRGRTSHRTNVLQGNYTGGLNYDGTGILVAHGDDGDIDKHIDYSGRLTSYAGPSGGNHGDHVAGTVFGAGNLDPKARGMAPGAEIAYFDYSAGGDIYLEGVDTMYANMGVRITQSSYSNGNNAGYTSLCREMDRDIRENRALMHVFSAGNAGTADHGYGAGAGWGNITGGHKQGKNVIATANLTWNDQLANSSSRGPAYDGRIKPDVGAVGTDVYSTWEPNAYNSITGTSMACPGVSGTLASLYQAFKVNHSQAEPDGGLMKAILMNTADDLGNAGPDFRHGYGRINALRAVKVIENDTYFIDSISQGATDTVSLMVGPNTSEMRVMVYWTDPEANVLASRALINDLNFTLYKGPNSWKPWVLDPTPNAVTLNNDAVRATDSLNNAEQITLVNPASGEYKIVVNGSSIPTGPQKYYVVYSLINNDIKVTHPIGGEHFAPNEQQIIRWDAPAGSTAFTIEYSIDNGVAWSSISSTVSAAARQFVWTVPNAVSGLALVRISQGAKTGISEAPFSIIGIPTGLNIAWVCPDSMKLDWNNVAGATGYEVSMLGQKYMDSVGASTLSEFVFKGINPTKEYWVSVRALGPNGCVGERAVAIKKVTGTFNCTLSADINLVDILSPSLVPSCQNSSGILVSANFYNNGTQHLVNIPVAYKIANNAIVRDTILDTIKSGMNYAFTFTTAASITGQGNYQIAVFAEMPTDQNTYNDTSSQTFYAYNGIAQAVPYTESFDSFSSCGTSNDCGQTSCSLQNGWLNLTNGVLDDVDFRTRSGNTGTSGTGPTGDHTSSTGKYLYIEASSCSDNEALLISPCFNLTGITQPNASIWYHMLGGTMGTLHVDVLADGIWYNDVVTPISGDQGSAWKQLQIGLYAYVGKMVNIRFRGITGSGNQSDIALDDFEISTSALPPTVDFISTKTSACLNAPVTLIDQSLPPATNWQWTITPSTFAFTGGTSATSKSPEIVFNALGGYSVKLVASNAFGTDSILKSNYIDVSNGEQLPITEDFSGTLPSPKWTIINPDGQMTWEQSGLISGANSTLTRAVWINNYNYNGTGEEDILETPAIDLNGQNQAYLMFDVAYARYDAANIDKLRIEISTDCGATFNQTTYNKQGLDLATATDHSSVFYPADGSEWRKEMLDLTSVTSNSIVIRFVATCGYGNSLFIDNINILADSTFGVAENSSLGGDIFLAPNPASNYVKLMTTFSKAQAINIELIDVTGKVLRKMLWQNAQVGNDFNLEIGNLPDGVYLVKLWNETDFITKRLVVKK